MNITARVRVLNFFRNIFRIPFLEQALAGLTQGKSPQHFFSRFAPNAYQYAPGTIRTVHRNGLTLQVDVSDYVGHFLFFGFKDTAQDNLFKLCKPGYHVIDVGTNIGWTLLNFGRLTHTGSVIGFEPDPFNHQVCKKNLSLNPLSNIQLLPFGLGNQDSEVQMEIRTPGNRGGNRIAPTTTHNTVAVQIRQLDLVEEVKLLGAIHLIKLDVEGYELHVLRGAINLLARYKPTLFIEVDDHNLNDQGDSAHSLIMFLEELGYTSIRHAETGQTVDRNFEFANSHFDIIAHV
ncbi:MAG: FkbM family methyltransferase [Cyclobacteriaceae bacterium]|nr:FkbM family methyltransferase [Cyclobacteriaceae bacterium]